MSEATRHFFFGSWPEFYYVSPDAGFRGVSRALLGALETRALDRGNQRCTLLGTETERRFYRSAGYVEEGPPRQVWYDFELPDVEATYRTIGLIKRGTSCGNHQRLA